MTMMGITTMIRWQFNPFGDQMFVLILMITWIFADLVKRFCLKMANNLKIWMRKSLENQRRNWSRCSWRP